MISIKDTPMNRLMIGCFALFVSCAFSSPPDDYLPNLTPYIGIQQQLNRMKFKDGHGDECFFKNHPQIDLYGGLRFDDSFSIEGGYISTMTKTRHVTLQGGQMALGINIHPAAPPIKFISHIKIRGYHLGITQAFHPCCWEKVRLIAGVGLAFLRAEAERSTILAINNPRFVGATRNFRKEKAILRLVGASEYKVDEHLGFRVSACFMPTHNMIIKSDVNNLAPLMIKPKDSFVFGLGVFFDF
jgi:hypothetical protein